MTNITIQFTLLQENVTCTDIVNVAQVSLHAKTMAHPSAIQEGL